MRHIRNIGNWFSGNKENKDMKEELKDQEKTINKNDAQSEKEEAKGQEIPVSEAEVKDMKGKKKKGKSSKKSAGSKKKGDQVTTLEDAMKVIAELQVQLKGAAEKIAEQENQILRLNADFDNFRKRKTKEIADNIRFANQELLLKILPVLDNFDRTLDVIDKTDNLAAVKEGIGLVDTSMKKQLKKVGLEPITSIGEEFNSEIHEAVTSIPVDEEDKKGMVVDEVEKGYKLKDRVIRFSKVIVGE